MRSQSPERATPAAAALAAITLLAGFLCAAGCSGDATGPPTRDEVTVHGFLYVGEAITSANGIRIGRVAPIDHPYDRVESEVADAVVVLQKAGAATADTLRRTHSGVYENPEVTIDSLTTYRLTVVIPGDRTLTATTRTPPPFTAIGGPPGAGTVSHAALSGDYPIDVECADLEQIFLCDVYCWEYWEDARYVNPFGDHDRPDDYQEYGGASGEPRHISAYFRLQNVVETPEGRRRIDFYSAMMAFYGLYEVNILAIDENCYNWLYRDHPEENGGIEGGLGVFGSAARRVWAVTVVE